jgi:hypothetical protein
VYFIFSARFLFFGSSLELLFDKFPKVPEDENLSLCSIEGTVKLSVVIPDNDDSWNGENLNYKQNNEATMHNKKAAQVLYWFGFPSFLFGKKLRTEPKTESSKT